MLDQHAGIFYHIQTGVAGFSYRRPVGNAQRIRGQKEKSNVSKTSNNSSFKWLTAPHQPEPEVVPRAKRRIFTTAYKLRIVREADESNQPGQIGALLRREGLYSSHLSNWRRQREAGQLAGDPAKREGERHKVTAREKEMVALRQENNRLQPQLAQAELIITAQKKLVQALEQTWIGSKEVRKVVPITCGMTDFEFS